MWTAERKPWTITSGSEEGGIYKTTDGGDTWTELTNGLPAGMIGRTGISVSAANPQRVWALVEARDGGVYRSDDAGASFQLINDDRELQNRPWYYMHIYADPVDVDRVYVVSRYFHRSDDAGETFDLIATPHGDNHDLWINPDNNRIMVQGNDGGANVSWNAGRTWSSQLNQPTSEMYRVSVDNQFPYRVYGSAQDTWEVISVPSRSAPLRHAAPAPALGRRRRHGGGGRGHPARQPEHRLLREHERRHHPLRPRHRPDPAHQGVSRGGGDAGETPPLPLPADRADRALAARPERALPRLARGPPLRRTRARPGRSSAPT